MKVMVRVFLKPSVFDPQGHTVKESLNRLGFSEVNDVRVGKLIELEISDDLSEEQKSVKIKQMCDQLLVNPVLESYELMTKVIH